MKHLIYGILAFSISGCIGTDFIAEAPETFDPILKITPDFSAMMIGDESQLGFSFTDEQGEPNTSVDVTWSSSDDGIASVSADGLVSANTVGQIEITASVGITGSNETRIFITDSPDAVSHIIPSVDTLSLALNETASIGGTIILGSGAVLSDPGFAVTWTSSDEMVAFVDEDGRVRAIGPGIAFLEVSAIGQRYTARPVTVIVGGPSRSGDFVERAGTGYNLSGSAILKETETGRLELSFSEDFVTSSGPGLFVYLSNASTVNSGSFEVRSIKNVRGAQTYEIPDNITLDDFNHVVIHCKPFNVTFGAARLR